MKKLVFKQTDPESMWCDTGYDFELEMQELKGVITGNRDYKEYGDNTLIDIIKGNYYDDDLGYDYETFEELKKITGKEYEKWTIRGYNQSDWNYIYLPKENVNHEEIRYIEAMFFGMYDEFYNDSEGSIIITHDVSFKGVKAIKKYIAETIGYKLSEVKIKLFERYKQVAVYSKEM